jgi:hypothetical protein
MNEPDFLQIIKVPIKYKILLAVGSGSLLFIPVELRKSTLILQLMEFQELQLVLFFYLHQ